MGKVTVFQKKQNKVDNIKFACLEFCINVILYFNDPMHRMEKKLF